MNKVILMGRLTRDPELKTSANYTTPITRFSLAINYGADTEPDFINCTAFDLNAERIAETVCKGDRLLVEGYWKTGHYTNRDGIEVYTNECIVNRFEYVEKRNEDDNNNSRGNSRNNNSGGGRNSRNRR